MEIDFSTLSWVWTATGVLMILAEFFVPGFVICFFGVSALIVAAICSVFSISLTWQLLIFAIAGVVLLFTCRRLMPGVFKGTAKKSSADIDNDDIAGASAVVLEKISPDYPGKVEFRGSCWEAAAKEELPPGTRVQVLGRKNIVLEVASLKK